MRKQVRSNDGLVDKRDARRNFSPLELKLAGRARVVVRPARDHVIEGTGLMRVKKFHGRFRMSRREREIKLRGTKGGVGID